MSSELVLTAFKKDGEFHVRNRPKLDAWTKTQRDGEFTVTVERAHATRSLEANALYWVAFVKPLSEYTGMTSREMHEYLKARFLPASKRKTKKLVLVNKRTGEVLDEYEVDLSTTTSLDKVEFSEYLRDIGIFAATLGVEVGSDRRDDAA